MKLEGIIYDCWSAPTPVFSLLPRLAAFRERVAKMSLIHVSWFAEVHNNYCVRCHKSHWCYLPSRHIGCCSQWCWTFSGGEILGMLAWFDFWGLIPIEHAPTLAVFLRMNHLRLKLPLIATCEKWKNDDDLQTLMTCKLSWLVWSCLVTSCGFTI